MVDRDSRHPVIADSDALISVANTSLWPCIKDNFNLTTTNVCQQELNRHVKEKSEYAREGSREKWVHDGSKAALKPFEDESNPSFTIATSVPRPHGSDAGEISIKQEIEQYPEKYTFAVLMDQAGRYSINRVFDERDAYGVAVAPPYLLYLLHKKEKCSKANFCQVCGELLEGEGWTSYESIQAVWEEIPVDCSDYLSSDLLP
ncbi:hypothetical protein [Haloprofundus salilacus]|uniref:hypothetical protein n=1 Tax=Haloprofundus salilacus TaxID=2876190 RepID=UPI001CCEEC95|nr:hypothetical protein [Haloprofundus salilacus]